MIRQAISCDICGTEKRQTNHWFVAYEQGGELRVSGWSSRHRLRPGSKHLCGQTCLHKLVDEFVAKSNAARGLHSEDEPTIEPRSGSHSFADTSLTSPAAYDAFESSARLISTPAPATPLIALRPALVPPATPPDTDVAKLALNPVDPPRYASRSWRSEAWERERQRELRAADATTGTRHRAHT